MSTKNKGGRTIRKHATLFTNDQQHPRLRLTISGSIDTFVTIQPKRVKLRGVAGDEIKREVTIIPGKKHPFKIVKVRARNGKDIGFQLSKEKSKEGQKYALTIENKRLQKGKYFDIVTLETDSKIRPELHIRVDGELRQRTEEEKKED